MLANYVEWVHVSGYSFNLNSDTWPLKTFDVQVDQRIDTSRNKMMEHGRWRTRSYRGGMSIHCEGSGFGDMGATDELTVANYVTARKQLVLALYGPPDRVVVEDYMGSLYVTPYGESEAWVAQYCTIEAFQAPVEALYPALTTYLITFQSFDPWFVGASSGTKYYWS